MSSITAARRIVLAGASTATAPLARGLTARDLGPAGILGRTPDEGAEAAAESPERTVPLRDGEGIRGAEIVVMAEGASWQPAPFEALAALVARTAPGAVVIVTGEGSSRTALRFLRACRLDPRRVLATRALADPPGIRDRAAGVGEPRAGQRPRHRARGRRGPLPEAFRPRRGTPREPPPAGQRPGLPEVLSMPALIGSGGIVGRLPLHLTLEERAFMSRERPSP